MWQDIGSTGPILVQIILKVMHWWKMRSDQTFGCWWQQTRPGGRQGACSDPLSWLARECRRWVWGPRSGRSVRVERVVVSGSESGPVLHFRLTILDQDRNSHLSWRSAERFARRIVRCTTRLIDTRSSCWALRWCGGGVAHRLLFGLTFAFVAMILIMLCYGMVWQTLAIVLLLVLLRFAIITTIFRSFMSNVLWMNRKEQYLNSGLTWNQIFTCREQREDKY